MTRRVPVAGGDICASFREDRPAGPVFVKELDGAPAGFFAAEARGLDRLRVDGGPLVPAVVEVTDRALVLEWVDTAAPAAGAASRFGGELARLHAAPEESFGGSGYAATIPLDDRAFRDWPPFFAEARLLPLVRAARDTGSLSAAGAVAVERVCARLDQLVPVEPPARLHGDLWSGNLLWGADGRVRLVDAAAAHAGHRETDLALLALFGAPHLDRVEAAYVEAAPLADGWRQRQGIHQLHPLLLHAVLFGGGYGAAVERQAALYL
ncbi:fructosamine kinase family protein [Klenkia taihuensis]|uniref:Fructosamine-3-kinase n=1 Tax=Klenkia taihuensis TaxID=1225127 RepID=A0A1I1K391_9ACTN|nr:fructosamine kinase family protein [Klenkia taihuensis]GHE10684.1 fructosamine kinase [Klenkia taihuensis]SFC52473.1 Fructosamine-3-kinase [Klenkia taihuensis]